MYSYKAVCDRVVDGDTIHATVDVGFYLKTKQSFRLHRINAPETRTKDLEEKARGAQSKLRLKELIEGKEIIIETKKAGKFGRWLVDIFLEGQSINDLLVEEGHAIYKNY